MSTLVHEFPDPFTGEDGVAYTVRVHGSQDRKNHWTGWVEFAPRSGAPPYQTGEETSQSTYEHLEYWALGLTEPYMEMALRRARDGTTDRAKAASRPGTG